MPSERNAFKAGLFIMLSVVLVVMISIMIKGLGRFTDPTVVRTCSFLLTDNIGGLRSGGDVRVGGLKVGVIKSVDLIDVPGGTGKILVYFTIPSRIDLHK